MTDKHLIESVLPESELFSGVDLSLVKTKMIKSFKRGEDVSELQNEIDCVGLVLSGSLSVASAEGGRVSVSKPGDVFGICNIFVPEKMPTTLKARVLSKVLFIPKDEFATLLSKDTALMYRYVKLCNEKMVYLAKKLKLLSTPNSVSRLACWIEMNEKDGFVDFIPKDELARQLCISRASLFRAWATLENEKTIEQIGKKLKVLNISALKSHSNNGIT